jgi:uncharacterized protein with PQ loop repeat
MLNSAQVAWRILTNRSVGSLSPLPFASLFANCLIWMYYGFLINDSVVYFPNMVGATIGMFCIFAYEAISTQSNIIVYSLVAVVTLLATTYAYLEDAKTLGILGVGIAALMTVAPLASLGTIMKERSTAAMPLIPSIMAFCNALSWTLYGVLVAHDFMVTPHLFSSQHSVHSYSNTGAPSRIQIYGPSLGGLFFSVIQLCLFVIYGLPGKHIAAPKPTASVVAV